VRLAVWTPLPPSASGIADYAAEQLPFLGQGADVQVVVEDPAAVVAPAHVRLVAAHEPVDADLDLYQIGNSPSHAYVYHAALARPGVVLLHDWSLHDLVLHETVGRGNRSLYLREMRRAHSETGTFVGRQVARALGGEVLPGMFPLNDRLLESSLGVVGLTAQIATRAAARLPQRPVLRLPHHLALPLDPPPTRQDARRALGLPQDAEVVVAPGLASAAKRLEVAIRMLARLRPAHPRLRLVIAGGVDRDLPLESWARDAGVADAVHVTGRLGAEDFVRHLAAADVLLALRFPSHGEISGALVRGLGVGRPALVTGGTPAAEEFPAGVVVPVDPGPSEADELYALVDHLLRQPERCDTIGRLAREHVRAHHDLAATTARLAAFLTDVAARRDGLRAEIEANRVPEDTLLGYLMDEVRWAALDLGLPTVPLDVRAAMAELAGESS
jgi:glycosyltransferase involved in cell wall biosynthesis